MKPDAETLNYNDDYIEKAGPGKALVMLTYLPGKPLPVIILSQSPKPGITDKRNVIIVNFNQLGSGLLRGLGQDEGYASRTIESWVESGENGAGVTTQCGVHKDMAAGLEVPGCLAENGDLACCIMCAIWVRHFAQHRAMCAPMANMSAAMQGLDDRLRVLFDKRGQGQMTRPSTWTWHCGTDSATIAHITIE